MLTHRAKYALKALLHLARQRGKGPVSAALIAECEHIPLKFLELILVQLRAAGVIRSKVGKGGGHELLQAPADISVLAIVRTIDGPVAPLPCLSLTAYVRCDDCADEQTCGPRRLMMGVHQASLEVMSRTTLADAMSETMPIP
jgi:Rrf2 family protein